VSIQRLQCTWTGFTGAPGYSNFYATGTAGAQLLFAPFWQAIAPYLPPVVSINVPNTGDTIDEATGKKIGTWANGVATATPGTATALYAPASGARINWGTGAFVNGRRVAGRTYLVPCSNSVYGADGLLGQTMVNAVNAAATSLFQNSGGALVIWTRPVYDHTGADPVLKTPGSVHPIISSTTPRKPTVLRSRRDT
jgi:hypothetical protein